MNIQNKQSQRLTGRYKNKIPPNSMRKQRMLKLQNLQRIVGEKPLTKICLKIKLKINKVFIKQDVDV